MKRKWLFSIVRSGSFSGGDLPRDMNLNPFFNGVREHNFIVVGDVWDGSTPGFDVATRRFRFTEPVE